jgi:curli biogenesis system outer membrane secretion channel CsgG
MRADPWRIACWLALAAGVGGGAGCARPKNPWVYAEPPAVSVNAYARPARADLTAIAVAPFTIPDAPQLDWPDVGTEMTNAMRRSLFNEGDFEVRIEPEIERLVSDPSFLRAQGKLVPEPLEVDFVIIGKVTDFHHTAALPKDASRWGLFGRRHEAVVAIEWKVVDVRARRVVAADHTYGTAQASRKKSIEELYAGLDPSAYLFWNTPLGRAGHQAIDKAIDRMRQLLPSEVGGQPTIVGVSAPRKLVIAGGWTWGLAEGQEYYVAARQEGRPDPQPVFDPDTGRPLMVRIGRVKKDSSTAWLLGKAPAHVQLEGAILSREPPSGLDDLAERDALADIRGEEGGS